MPSRSKAELTAAQLAWVTDYERAEAQFDGELRKGYAPPAPGWFASLAKAILVDAGCRGLMPESWIEAAFARWPALGSE